MPALPTDLEILSQIFDDYYNEYVKFTRESPNRKTKIYVPIDIPKLARKLNTDVDIVFGRLYYHLEHKYGYKDDEGVESHFFANGMGGFEHREKHLVNFPYMASVLAELKHAHRTYRNNLIAAVVSAACAVFSLVATGVQLANSKPDSPPKKAAPALPVPNKH